MIMSIKHLTMDLLNCYNFFTIGIRGNKWIITELILTYCSKMIVCILCSKANDLTGQIISIYFIVQGSDY